MSKCYILRNMTNETVSVFTSTDAFPKAIIASGCLLSCQLPAGVYTFWTGNGHQADLLVSGPGLLMGTVSGFTVPAIGLPQQPDLSKVPSPRPLTKEEQEWVDQILALDWADPVGDEPAHTTNAKQSSCDHEWKETPGFSRMYRDCKHCKARWEDVHEKK